MIILALDTANAQCTATLMDAAVTRASRSEMLGRGHAERLAPMVAEVLNEADISPNDIDKISVCTGPGSFTGLRVALAFAKGFALPHNIPVVGLSALEVWAAEADPHNQQSVIAIADVRRGELCWAHRKDGVMITGAVTEPADLARAKITALAPDIIVEDAVTSGETLARLARNITPDTHPAAPLYSRPPDAKLPGGITPP